MVDTSIWIMQLSVCCGYLYFIGEQADHVLCVQQGVCVRTSSLPLPIECATRTTAVSGAMQGSSPRLANFRPTACEVPFASRGLVRGERRAAPVSSIGAMVSAMRS